MLHFCSATVSASFFEPPLVCSLVYGYARHYNGDEDNRTPSGQPVPIQPCCWPILIPRTSFPQCFPTQRFLYHHFCSALAFQQFLGQYGVASCKSTLTRCQRRNTGAQEGTPFECVWSGRCQRLLPSRRRGSAPTEKQEMPKHSILTSKPSSYSTDPSCQRQTKYA